MVSSAPLSLILRLRDTDWSMRSVLVILISALVGTLPLWAAQQAAHPSTQAAAPANVGVQDLKTRLNALERAKHSNDLQKVDDTSKAVIALGLRQMAGLRLLQSAFPETIELYKRSLDFEDLPEAHVNLVAVYARAKQVNAPVRTVKDPTAPLDPTVVKRANMTDTEKKQAKIREQELRSVLASALNDLGTSEARRQQYELALAHFHEAERWQATIPGLMRNLGIAAFRLAKYPEAARALRQVVSQNSMDNAARTMLGVSLFMMEQYADAVRVLGPIRDQIVGDPAIAYALASSLIKVNEPKEAASVLDALEKQKLSPDTLLLIGQSWAEMGDNAHALSTFRKALAQNQSLANAHYYSGLALIHLDQPQEAGKEFQAELAVDPSNSEAQYHLAYALLQQSRIAEAKTILSDVVAAHPEHAEAQYQLGKILLDEGRAADAITHLEMAARLSPQEDYVHYQLQAAYRKDSRPADAERELKIYREIKARNRQRSAAQPASIPEAVQH